MAQPRRSGASATDRRRGASPRILFVTREGYDLPGARIRCYQFASELARYGLQAEVLSFADTLGAKSGAREHEMTWPTKLWLNARAFLRLCRKPPTVLILSRCHYHAFGPILHHLCERTPLILDLDDWEMRDHPAYRWGWYPTSKAHWLTRWLARRSAACLAASRPLYDLLRPWNARVQYLPTAVDTTRFRPQRQTPHRASVTFAWIGTFHHREYVENLRFLIEGFGRVRPHVPEARLDIVGDGLYRREVLAALTGREADGVRWLGWKAPEEIPAYLDTVDVGCYPVVRDTPFHRAKSPTKLFEYMAMGKAIVASEVGEASRVIRAEDTGLLAGTPSQFTEAMVRLGRDAGLRERLGEAAMRTAREQYSLARLGQQLYRTVRQVMTENKQ